MELPTGFNLKPKEEIKVEKKNVRKFTFINDPGHGWLSVSYKDLIELDLVDKISSHSYMNASRVFLEEDCDLSLFIKALNKAGFELETIDSYKDLAPQRNYSSYCYDWIKNPLAIGRKVYLYDGREAEVIEKNKKGWTIKTNDGARFHLPRLNPLAGILPKPQKQEQKNA